MVKLPLNILLNASLDMLRLNGDLRDGFVLVVDRATGAASFGSLKNDPSHAINVLEATLNCLKKQSSRGRMDKIGLVIPD